LFCLVVLGFGCKKSDPTVAAPEPEPVVAASSKATIEAKPNPVPASASQGSTEITWNTGEGSPGQVWVSQDGAAEQLFSEGDEGTKAATWIQAGSTYEFRLYAGTNRKQLLAKVSVKQSGK
jgi:hypothetical protein